MAILFERDDALFVVTAWQREHVAKEDGRFLQSDRVDAETSVVGRDESDIGVCIAEIGMEFGRRLFSFIFLSAK